MPPKQKKDKKPATPTGQQKPGTPAGAKPGTPAGAKPGTPAGPPAPGSPTSVANTTKLPDGSNLNLKKDEVGAAPTAAAGAGGSVDTSAIDAAMNELKTKYSNTSTEVGSVNTNLREIPPKILALRSKGGSELDEIRKKLKEAEEKANKDVSGYLAGLATSIKSISIDGLEAEMNILKTHQTEINDALDNAGKKEGAPAGPPSGSPSGSSTATTATTANKSGSSTTTTPTTPPPTTGSTIGLLTSSPATMVPDFNKTVKQLDDELANKIETMKKAGKKASDYSRYVQAKGNLVKATTIPAVKDALKLVSKDNKIFGGKRTRKVSRKRSKHSKKSRRRSRRH